MLPKFFCLFFRAPLSFGKYSVIIGWSAIGNTRSGIFEEGLAFEINRMEALGEDGWECYAVLKMPESSGVVHREYHFKRKRSVLNLGFKQTKTGTSTRIKAELKKG